VTPTSAGESRSRNRNLLKEFALARNASAQFEHVMHRAQAASGRLKAAAEGTKDRLSADVASTTERAAAAQRLTDKAAKSEDEASSHRRELREK
jgi:hypothetical protein